MCKISVSWDMELNESHLSTQSSVSSDKWFVLGRAVPKSQIVFLSQIIILYTVIITSIINLSIGNTSETWLILVSTCVGAVLPNPRIKSVTRVPLKPAQSLPHIRSQDQPEVWKKIWRAKNWMIICQPFTTHQNPLQVIMERKGCGSTSKQERITQLIYTCQM